MIQRLKFESLNDKCNTNPPSYRNLANNNYLFEFPLVIFLTLQLTFIDIFLCIDRYLL